MDDNELKILVNVQQYLDDIDTKCPTCGDRIEVIRIRSYLHDENAFEIKSICPNGHGSRGWHKRDGSFAD